MYVNEQIKIFKQAILDYSLFNGCVNASHVLYRDYGNLIRIIWH